MEKSLKASPLFFIEKNKERILMKNSKGVVFKRQQEILKLLQEHRQLSVEELSSRLEVSEITIRRDLQRFEDQGLIERFYGGAKYISGKIEKENIDQKQYNSTKKNIARRASGLVREHDMVFINSGSTAFLLLNYLADENVTILTNNGRSIFKKASSKASIVLSGGEIFEQKKSLVGDFAINSFSKARANICFLGVGGINKNGITTVALPETAVNRVILERTNGPKIIVAEGAKVGRESNFHTADCSMITHLITDYSADAETVAYLKSIGVKVLFIS